MLGVWTNILTLLHYLFVSSSPFFSSSLYYQGEALLSAYCASKQATEAFTFALAFELAGWDIHVRRGGTVVVVVVIVEAALVLVVVVMGIVAAVAATAGAPQ